MAFYDLMTYQQIIKSMDKMNEKRENEVNLDWVVVVHDTRFMHQLCLCVPQRDWRGDTACIALKDFFEWFKSGLILFI